MSHTLDITRLEEIFEGLEEHDMKFTQWERTFIESVHEQYQRLGKLSERQCELLEQLWLRV